MPIDDSVLFENEPTNAPAEPEPEKEEHSPEDICQLCLPIRERRGLDPNLLVLLPNPTLNQSLAVRVCPDCDGGVVRLATRS